MKNLILLPLLICFSGWLALSAKGSAPLTPVDAFVVSQGYGEYCPLDDRSAPAAWDKNRRVDFKVVKTEDGMTGVKRGCEKARAGGIFPPEVK